MDPVAEFRSKGGENLLKSADGVERLSGASHEALRTVARRRPAVPLPPGLPPFCGGWIGWFAYEWASSLEPSIPRAEQDDWDVPDATFDLYERVVAFDHAAQKLFVITACSEDSDASASFAQANEVIDGIAADLGRGLVQSGGFKLLDEEPLRSTSAEDYERGVEGLQKAVSQGQIFQGVLSQSFQQRFEGDAFTLYRVLRLTNPAPHMFFFEADGLQLAGSSPERLVSVLNGRAQVVPIAGTRARSDDPDQDDRLAADLMRDPKERAEHDMLVDLARNDLGRVARTGSVTVKEHASLQKFARVQHLVSRVECDLASGFDALDALAASFPAGTVSGAPKIRAMQLLAKAEGRTRGPYAGAFGYLDARGNLDMCITIRSIVVRDQQLTVQAGAGVVFDSKPDLEEQETRAKASALLDAVKMAADSAFQPLATSENQIGNRPGKEVLS